MKKVIFLFLVLLGVTFNVKGQEFINYEYVNGYYFNGYLNGSKISYNAVYKTHNGDPLYCLEFGVPISKELGYSVRDFRSSSNFTEEQKKYIEIIAFFGYGYKNHNHLNYYFATQELIWNALGTDLYWTKSKNGTDRIDLTEYKNEILNLYEEYINEEQYKREEIIMEVGNTYVFEDSHVYLPKYEYWYDGPSEITQTENAIYITPLIKGNETLLLERSFGKGFLSYLFLQPGFQTVVKAGNIENKSRMINFEINDSYINFTRVNMEENMYKNKYINLKGAEYELYDSDYNYLTTFITDINGKAKVEDLPLGIYRVKEIKPSYGFEPYEYYTDVTIFVGNAPSNATLQARPIKKELTITNHYKVDGILYKEKGLIFDVYRDGYLNKRIYTDEEGMGKTELEYGRYFVRQLTGRDDFELEKEFEVIVDETDTQLDFFFLKERGNKEEIVDTNENESIETIIDDIVNDEDLINTEIPLEFEDNLNINIEKLPQLDITLWDFICENLLFLLLL